MHPFIRWLALPLAAGAAGAAIGTFLTPTEAGVLLCLAAVGYIVWMACRRDEG